MKFVSVVVDGRRRSGVLDGDGSVALMVEGLGAAFGAGASIEDWTVAGRAALAGGAERVPADQVRLGAPVQPGKIVCVGANYAEHVRESGAPMPTEPILFLKTPDTVVGPTDEILVPRGSEHTDWEVELGVVIGRQAAYLPDDARSLEYVAGYVLANDLSERHFQLERGGTWDKGKNCPTFCPLGPYLVTSDEVPDPQDVRIGLDVNGTAYQDASTADMIFDVELAIRYISQYMTLYPGDVVLTGTPVGVGMGQSPPRYLAAGDSVRVWGEGLGEQLNPVAGA
ncbi:fumarylacetoacetate hydrolase family protein [Ruania zhangjianzhongii]|uniref:fumarylacetoacetate hydrolase family protein n=1 Tax=Ruania zhangjianzhongii TaxID=2603206 RepID=UPI0011C977F2|nr:fumarylacetoacetate hydrolase family protein [Ruania zhangjianzhongii]